MIILDTTTRKLQALADASATTTESPIVVSYDDITTTAFTPGASQTITTGSTAVDIVAAPAASTQRAVKFISVYNADTAAHTYTFRYNDNGTTRILFAPLLAVGQSATYCNGQWSVLPTYQSIDPGLCEGRLTLTTAVPVTTSDVTGATTVYFTPYKGNRISLYTNSAWTLYTFTEKSVALGTLGSATIPNDVFIYDNSGTLTLEMVAWSSTTARATALVLQDGVLVKSGSTNKRYLGTFTPTSTTTTEDSVLNRQLGNYYNRQPREILVTDATGSWTQTATSFTQRGSKQANFTICVQEIRVRMVIRGIYQHALQGHVGSVGLGLDSNTNVAQILGFGGQQTAGFGLSLITSEYFGYPSIGSHSMRWLEATDAGTVTFFGIPVSVLSQAGILGEIDA